MKIKYAKIFQGSVFLVAVVVTLLAACGGGSTRRSFYVSTTGNDTNDGSTEATSWRTVQYAASKATAGDTVYIKAGLYTGEEIWISNSGTADAPIIFQGYYENAGDTPNPNYTPGIAINSSLIPVIEGIENKSTIGSWGASYYELRNLGVTKGRYGIFPQYSHDVVIENVYVTDIGLNDGAGQGIWLRWFDNFTIRNSVVTDAGMCNILLENSTNGLVENAKTYAVAYASESADYHIVLMNAQNVTVQNSQSYNLHSYNGGHAGHGIGIKDTHDVNTFPYYLSPHSTNNKIINCEAYNMGEYFFVAHEAHNNEFINCKAQGDYIRQAYWSEGINIRDGAHDNIFNNMRVEGTRTSIAFQDTKEGPYVNDKYLAQFTNNNTITNSVFTNSDVGIQMWNADNNTFTNNVFDNAGTATLVQFVSTRKNLGNIARNSIVTNMPGSFQTDDWASGSVIPFTYSDFWINNFTAQAGNGNLSVDPLFANATNGDYHLKSAAGRWNDTSSIWLTDTVTSPCIDAGSSTDAFSLEPAPNGGRINIGAYGNTIEASKTN